MALLIDELAGRIAEALVQGQKPELKYVEADEGEVMIEQLGWLLAHRVECRTPIGCRECGRLIRVRAILLELFW